MHRVTNRMLRGKGGAKPKENSTKGWTDRNCAEFRHGGGWFHMTKGKRIRKNIKPAEPEKGYRIHRWWGLG